MFIESHVTFSRLPNGLIVGCTASYWFERFMKVGEQFSVHTFQFSLLFWFAAESA